jgi:hypothetical protein
MIVFRGLSNFSAAPAAVRDGVGDRLGRMTPVEAWCRASTLLVLRRQDELAAARSGFTSRPPALAANRWRDDCHAFVAQFCFAEGLSGGWGRTLVAACRFHQITACNTRPAMVVLADRTRHAPLAKAKITRRRLTRSARRSGMIARRGVVAA